MKVRRYLVNNMPEAMEAIRRDLGPEAVIVSTRRVRQGAGVAKWLRSPRLEVTAAVDDYPRRETDSPAYAELQHQIGEIKHLLQKVSTERDKSSLPETVLKWKDVLTRLEVNEEITAQLLEGLTPGSGAEGMAGEEGLRDELLRRLTAFFRAADGSRSLQRIVAFVGPTGVGKTTTLAKLAARLALFEGKNVSLVTTDTYRIGATEQLRTYGEIMGLPVDVVMTPKDMGRVLEQRRSQDIILVDTPGRSPQNLVYRQELVGYLSWIPEADIFLVLSCVTKTNDLLHIAANYREVGVNKLIFTKLDETDSWGAMLNVVQATGLPIAYLTNGQNVPDDLVEAQPEELARRILGVD